MDANTKYQVVGLLGVGGLGGVVAYYLRARVDVWRASRGAEVSTGQAPVQILLKIVENKEREASELRKEASEARTDLKLLMTNHLEHDKIEREEFVKILTEQTSMLRKTCEMLVEDRQSSSEQRKAIHDRITSIAIKQGVQA